MIEQTCLLKTLSDTNRPVKYSHSLKKDNIGSQLANTVGQCKTRNNMRTE